MVLCVALFIGLSILARWVFPFGDEPDFGVRAVELAGGNAPKWTPYALFDHLLSQFTLESNVLIDASPSSLSARIVEPPPFEPNWQRAARVGMLLLVCAPLFALMAFGDHLEPWFVHRDHLERARALAVSMLLPSIIYGLGLLSVEQYGLALALVIVTLRGCWIAVACLTGYYFTIDPGNCLVVIAFLCLLAVNQALVCTRRALLFASAMLVAPLVAYQYGDAVLGMVARVGFLTGKSEAIQFVLLTGVEKVKYPLYERPLITFITSVFMTPSYVKVTVLYLPFFGALVWLMWRSWRSLRAYFAVDCGDVVNRSDVRGAVEVMTCVEFVLVVVFIAPTYAYCKYYLFLAPLFVQYTCRFVNVRLCVALLLMANAIVFATLGYYRMAT